MFAAKDVRVPEWHTVRCLRAHSLGRPLMN